MDLVILDQNMPGLSGTQTLKKLRERWPLLPVIIGTGYLDSAAAALVASFDRVKVLQKPYSGSELGQAIKQVLLA